AVTQLLDADRNPDPEPASWLLLAGCVLLDRATEPAEITGRLRAHLLTALATADRTWPGGSAVRLAEVANYLAQWYCSHEQLPEAMRLREPLSAFVVNFLDLPGVRAEYGLACWAMAAAGMNQGADGLPIVRSLLDELASHVARQRSAELLVAQGRCAMEVIPWLLRSGDGPAARIVAEQYQTALRSPEFLRARQEDRGDDPAEFLAEIESLLDGSMDGGIRYDRWDGR
ncbi:hypothetical protein, partial [Micromonospora sp. NPDC051296]|uniref:hypothetical protein n=1 Tax=Micromonospora sp. NPDC051296 TaxID=3155046 RepID=UPI00343CF0F3